MSLSSPVNRRHVRPLQSSLSVQEVLTEELRRSLTMCAGRVIDLLHEWDSSGDGFLDRHEFHEGLREFGFDGPEEEIDQLFDAWDLDQTGAATHHTQHSHCMLQGSGVPDLSVQ